MSRITCNVTNTCINFCMNCTNFRCLNADFFPAVKNVCSIEVTCWYYSFPSTFFSNYIHSILPVLAFLEAAQWFPLPYEVLFNIQLFSAIAYLKPYLQLFIACIPSSRPLAEFTIPCTYWSDSTQFISTRGNHIPSCLWKTSCFAVCTIASAIFSKPGQVH